MTGQQERPDWPALITIFVVVPIAGTLGGCWAALVAFLVCAVVLGFSKRSATLGTVTFGEQSASFSNFNEQELIKIRDATRGVAKKSARAAISAALRDAKPRIDAAKNLESAERAAALQKLAEVASAARHRALRAGASSHGDADWAAAAAWETWVHELMHGNPETIARVETLISELASRA